MTLNSLAFFASRHPKVAAGLIILSECTNAVLGLLLGSSLLADQPGWYLSFLLGGLVLVRFQFGRYIALRLPELVSRERFWFQKHSYAVLFLINFLAYGIAGGISGRTIIHPEPSVSVASERSSSFSVSSEKDTLAAVSSTQPTSQTAVSPSTEKPHTGTKIAYVLLFLASIPLFILSSRLACSLACSNQGFAAVFVILLGLGVLAGGFYFLGRALDKTMKPYKQMTASDRKREGRRFGRTLLGTVLGLLIFALLPSLLR
ncbi:hypothetical protein [Larkinella humicola]|uniref:Uncharacterized protein n=1 Tax=Larkinella humicola TaxID=2607654 RepID=A0A5N1J5U8_9BACT|nr:hypothetical protein [Larkinella humicola]KAA9346286.1 hypothetical protein F0P93_28885 [Larkinella humicola]